jgi:hypothetical protein
MPAGGLLGCPGEKDTTEGHLFHHSCCCSPKSEARHMGPPERKGSSDGQIPVE